MKQNRLFSLVLVGVMTALATVIYLVFPEIPVVPGIEYLKIDLSDIPAMLTGMTVGPFYGVAVEFFKNALHLFRTTTVGVGEVMNFVLGSVLVLTLSSSCRILAKRFSLKEVACYYIGAGITVCTTIVCGWVLNALLTPVYFLLMGIPLDGKVILAGVFSSTLLNVIKAVVTVFPFYPLVKAVKRLTEKTK